MLVADPLVFGGAGRSGGCDGRVVGGDESDLLGLLCIGHGWGCIRFVRILAARRSGSEGDGCQRAHLQHVPPIRHDLSAYARVVWEGSREAEHVG